MNVDSIIFFILVLFVWGLSVAARWFQEQMRKHSTDGIEFEPIDWSSGPELETVPTVQAPETPVLQELPVHSISDQNGHVRRNKVIRRFGLGNRQTFRQGIILMTVLGPCRALEPSNETKPF